LKPDSLLRTEILADQGATAEALRDHQFENVSIRTIAGPATLWLLGLGSLGLVLFRLSSWRSGTAGRREDGRKPKAIG